MILPPTEPTSPPMPTRTPIPPADALSRTGSAPAPTAPGPSVLGWAATRLRSVHLAAGLVLLVAFLGTGQYMDLRYDHLRGMDDATRLLFRSNHIYILFCALLNLALAGYLAPRPRAWAWSVQVLGSAMLLVASALLVRAFFVEPLGPGLERPLTRPALYLVLYGVLFHLVTRWGQGTPAPAPGSDG